MDGERGAFRIYLSSDSSRFYHPNNTRASFGVHLSETIKLRGEYEVAISQVITTNVASPEESPVFIYSNISSKIYLADSRARCLRILPPLKSSDANSFEFEQLNYEVVEFPEFQDVYIHLKNREGEAYNLSSSGPPTIVTLHFRPARHD